LVKQEGIIPEFAVAIYYGLKILAATLVSRFYSSTYLLICLRRKISPTARFATVFCASPRYLPQNLGLFNHISTNCTGEKLLAIENKRKMLY
jgi:hypothetical protein